MRSIVHLSASVVALSVLSACSDGGGSGINSAPNPPSSGNPSPAPTPAPTPTPTPAPTPTPTPTPTPPPPTYQDPVAPPAGYVITPSDQQPIRSENDTEEYRRNYGSAEYVNALYALDNKWTGKGVTVGVIDNGVVNVNGELDGRIDETLSHDFGYEIRDGVRTKGNTLGDEMSTHGTPVANVIGAAANGTGAVGYAPDVTIAVLRVDDRDFDKNESTLWYLDKAIQYGVDNNIQILNASITGGGTDGIVKALENYAKVGGLLVNSAGNYSEDNPRDASWVTDATKDSILFVGAVNGALHEYQLDGYSNKAGDSAVRYVVAPGTNITTMLNGGPYNFSGTSSAAPVVSALAADILSKWPQLSGQDAGNIILTTAKDIGEPGVDAVFGHGLVDFRAALEPVNPTLSNGSTQTALNGSAMVVPSAINAASIQSALSKVTVLDEFGRDYSGSMSGLVIKPESNQGHWLRRRVAGMGATANMSLGTFSGTMGYAVERYGNDEGDVSIVPTAGSIAYTTGRTELTAGWNAADSLQSDIMGLAPYADGVLAYAPQAGNSFGVARRMRDGSKWSLTLATGSIEGSKANAVTIGWSKARTDLRLAMVDETGSVMGMPQFGALALGRGATTVYGEAHHSVGLAGGWNLDGYGSVGVTWLKKDPSSLVTGSTALVGTRLGIQASRPVMGGVFSFGLAQPLNIESGKARLSYGSGYDLESRSLVYSNTEASLAGQRRVQLTAGFAKTGYRSSLRVGVMQDLSNGSTRALAGTSLLF